MLISVAHTLAVVVLWKITVMGAFVPCISLTKGDAAFFGVLRTHSRMSLPVKNTDRYIYAGKLLLVAIAHVMPLAGPSDGRRRSLRGQSGKLGSQHHLSGTLR